MSLDIAILDDRGQPTDQVSIGLDDHDRLMRLVGDGGGLLARLREYYAGAEYQHSELEQLSEEVRQMTARCPDDGRLSSFLKKLLALTETAKSRQKPLVALAD